MENTKRKGDPTSAKLTQKAIWFHFVPAARVSVILSEPRKPIAAL